VVQGFCTVGYDFTAVGKREVVVVFGFVGWAEGHFFCLVSKKVWICVGFYYLD
jgi:hypothetical protein